MGEYGKAASDDANSENNNTDNENENEMAIDNLNAIEDDRKFGTISECVCV